MTSPAGVVDGLLADRYRLRARLGTGGMGEVWRADDVLLHRTVAVKTLLDGRATDDESRARFRSEARSAARLSHPGIATVYDFGELPGRAWLVMELVEGEALSSVLEREGSLGAERTLDIVGQVAAALHAAHEAGVVHRDVKPGNLMVRPDGVVKVTDFGIAATADAPTLTQTGQVVGTAGYLSPEQASGAAGSPATDLYALGVVAYECLSGERPFAADSPLAELLGHLQAAPPALPGDIPAPVSDLVLRLLAKDPGDRPADAAALADEARHMRAALLREGAGAAGDAAVADTATDRTATATDRTATDHGVAGHAAVDDGARDETGQQRGTHVAGATSRRTQRWAVRLTAVLLALLAIGLGVRGTAGGGSTSVPAIAVGTPEAQAAAALRSADLRPVREVRPDGDLPNGQVLEVRPAAGTTLDRGDDVVLVVSTGPAPPPVPPADRTAPDASTPDQLPSGRNAPDEGAPGGGTAGEGTSEGSTPDVVTPDVVTPDVVTPGVVAPDPVEQDDQSDDDKGRDDKGSDDKGKSEDKGKSDDKGTSDKGKGQGS